MLKSLLTKTVAVCISHPWTVLAVWAVLTLASGVYAATHFVINTDISDLISSDVPWRQRELAFDKAFPDRYELILAVVDAPTPELATEAANALTGRLQQLPQLIRSVSRPDSGPFLEQEGLLFLPAAEVQALTQRLDEASPLVATLAGDPTLRGLAKVLSLGLTGVEKGRLALADMARPLTASADALENALAGRPASFSWQQLASPEPPQPRDLRRFIEIKPVLDFAALEPGKAASDAIRRAASEIDFAGRYQARVRLTGPIPIADEEFATVRESAVINGLATVLVVLGILWLALRSGRIILAVMLTVVAGLATTAAVGLMLVGSLNMISVAFAVLFVGLGVDFGIQFAVRYRAERHETDDMRAALLRAAEHAGPPLTLAAAAVAAGFLSFLPTAYSGVSELGQIAGAGMIIAFLTSITMLPALLALLNLPGEPEPIGYRALAPVDRFLERRRIPVLVGTGLVVLLGTPLLFSLHFDFNPFNLRNQNVESIATYLDLRRDPTAGGNAIQALAASQAEAKATADKLAELPEVARVMTLANFVPEDQEQKLPHIRELAETLGPTLETPPDPAPSDAENVTALKAVAARLTAAAQAAKDGAAPAQRLAQAISALADATPATRERAEAAFIRPLHTALDGLKSSLKAHPVDLESLPAELAAGWTAPDGRARIEAHPKGDPNDLDAMRAFAKAVLAKVPNAIGGPISIIESGHTIIRAFIEAGCWAVLSIAILLWIVLRRFGDVLLTLIPLLLAGMVTLEVTVLIGLPLNFANIIALPLLLGLGVAFKIYYIMAWRAGQTQLLQTSLTRAVIYSAMTTATAFGSLWLSSHPGTSSMGKLLALSLACTLAAAVLFQPALMGKPRTAVASGPGADLGDRA